MTSTGADFPLALLCIGNVLYTVRKRSVLIQDILGAFASHKKRLLASSSV
jgi:hypothetical protein